MNNAINEIINTLEGTNSRITEAEDRISEVEDRMVEINEAEKAMATHFSILPWNTTEEPGRLQHMGSHRIKQD